MLATGGTWRWQMSLPLGDPTHSVFWQQLLHGLVSETRGQLSAQVSAGILEDDGHVQLLADVRDKDYLPAADAVVNAHIIGPDRLQADVSLRAVPGQPGRYQTDWTAPAVGTYVADLTANQGALSAGRDTIAFQRQDGVAENFHTGQNVALLNRSPPIPAAAIGRPVTPMGWPAPSHSPMPASRCRNSRICGTCRPCS